MEHMVLFIIVYHLLIGAELGFGDHVVRNNSFFKASNIPAYSGDVPDGATGPVNNTLLCASDTTNSTTRQWYDKYGVALGTAKPSLGVYQANDSDSGGVLLYSVGDIDRVNGAGLHYCRISDSSGNIQTLYVGLYTLSGSGLNGATIGKNFFWVACMCKTTVSN